MQLLDSAAEWRWVGRAKGVHSTTRATALEAHRERDQARFAYLSELCALRRFVR